MYECASVLVALSTSATAIRAAANSYTQLLSSQSDNNIKLIVLERLQVCGKREKRVGGEGGGREARGGRKGEGEGEDREGKGEQLGRTAISTPNPNPSPIPLKEGEAQSDLSPLRTLSPQLPPALPSSGPEAATHHPHLHPNVSTPPFTPPSTPLFTLHSYLHSHLPAHPIPLPPNTPSHVLASAGSEAAAFQGAAGDHHGHRARARLG